MRECSPSDPRGLNCYNTLIQIASDSKVAEGTVPVARGEKRTVALIQYELLVANPYRFTQAELLFETFVEHKGIPEGERAAAWEAFWAKPQACMRASPLPKQFGWGVHFDAEGRAALCGVESEAYRQFSQSDLTQLKAMRSSRA